MNHPSKERSLVILKPDAIQRGLIGELIARIERVGLKVVALKMTMATADQCWKHYNKDDAWFLAKGEKILANRQSFNMSIEKEAIEYGKDIIGALVKFMTCGPVVAMVIEGNQAVSIVKKIVGGTEPSTSAMGTIRGDFALDSYELAGVDDRAVRNLIHCSDQVEEAQRETAIWFKAEEILNYNVAGEKTLYAVNLEGILE